MSSDTPPVIRDLRRKFLVHRKTAFVALCLACYGGLAAYQLSRPGLEYDEAIFAPAALGRTQDFLAPSLTLPLDSVSRFSPISFSTFSLSVGSYSVPVMVVPYCGALKVYLLAAVFSLWEVSPLTLRLPNVVVGILTLICFLFFLRHTFSLQTALVALVFLASDPSYIFYTRHDFNPSALVLLLVCAPLWGLAHWKKTGRTWVWAVSFFLFGLGVYNRLDYLWFLAAGGGTALAYWRVPALKRIGRKEIILAGACFTLGCAPYLLFVWQRPTIAASVRSFATPAQDLSAVIRLKGYVLWTVLNGASLYDFFANRSAVNLGKVVTAEGEVRVGSYDAGAQALLLSSLFSGTLTPYCLCAVGVLLWFSRPPPALKVLGTLFAALLLCLFAVPGAVRGHHFVILLPFAQALLAGSLVFLREKLNGPWARGTIAGLGVMCVAANLAVDLRYHRFLAVTGGRGVWSEAIYDLTQYLQEHCVRHRCLVGDWGIGTQVVTLSGGKLPVEEVFWPYIQGEDGQMLENLVRQENALFIFYSDAHTNFSRPKHLIYDAARRAELDVIVQRWFTERDRTPLIEVVKVAKRGGV